MIPDSRTLTLLEDSNSDSHRNQCDLVARPLIVRILNFMG